MKKDKNKNAPSEELNQNNEALEKDYQKEEDKDVKEKHKITKIIIAIILFIAIVFVFLLIRHIKNESAEKFYDVNGEHAVDAAAIAEASDGKIEVDGCLLDLTGETVVVTVPLEYYEDKQPADTLSEAEKASGYVSVKKTGGNVIYTIKTAYYPSVVSNLYEAYADAYQEESFLEENHVLRFAQFSYMQKFNVIIEGKDPFSAPDYYDLLEHAYYQSAIYQSYLGILPGDIEVVFQFKNHGAQFTFAEYKFPDLKGKNLSSVAINKSEGTAPDSAYSKIKASAEK